MSYRVPMFKEYVDQKGYFDRSWIENGVLWAESETEDGTMMMSLQTKLENCRVQIYWRSAIANEESGLNCVVNIRKSVLNNDDIDDAIEQFESLIYKEHELQDGDS